MRKLIIAGLVAGAVPLVWLHAHAAVEERARVIGCGGDHVTTALYNHSFTVGQGAVGVVTDVAHIHSVGFWYATPYASSEVPDSPAELPDTFALESCTPNPLGAVGSITYAVPVPSHVTIRLYDAAGRVVRTLMDGDAAPGYHQARMAPGGLISGIYFCRMDAAGFSSTKKMVLLR